MGPSFSRALHLEADLETPRDQLAARYPGRQIGTIGDAALPAPDTLAIVIGHPPDEVAKIIYVLCTETSSYVNGAEIHINGGQHV